jgi:hypothetical protein
MKIVATDSTETLVAIYKTIYNITPQKTVIFKYTLILRVRGRRGQLHANHHGAGAVEGPVTRTSQRTAWTRPSTLY